MTAVTTPAQQSDGRRWREGRIGRFTSSCVGPLFKEPRSLSAKHVAEYAHLLPEISVADKKFKTELRKRIEEKNIILFGDGAMKVIAAKAGERRTGAEEKPEITTRSMDRGTILEHVAKFLLTQHWKPIADIGFQPYKDYAGATPDGSTDKATTTWDCKAPESYADVILFEQQVKDNDFETMLEFDEDWAWQIATQAVCAKTPAFSITLFTDRLPIYKLEGSRYLEDGFTINPSSELNICQRIIDKACELMSQERPWAINYTYPTDGWYAVSRRFDMTNEIHDRIVRTLAAADLECEQMLHNTMQG